MFTLEETVEKLKENISAPPGMEATTATYQFILEGDGGGNYILKFQDGRGSIEQGTAENPDVTITMQVSDFIDLVSGKLNAITAFMTGKLTISGDFNLALKLQSLL
ncbi:Putative sterol carrier protein [Desulfofundulus australicus DSM 11792]|uniref:Putative sterol carrier protein n=1 Tax=Desulfofundulus australicus DSM 11792 TaxID=1121425 RepID=A0A1M5AKN9_9FIRM|nr:SCP2 sterol-binding domain-containing protein [Desulfofundulus australicus]SHF30831.1 Putative sterol carrier protein [Desulfofundulus australicus DSM 11792]